MTYLVKITEAFISFTVIFIEQNYSIAIHFDTVCRRWNFNGSPARLRVPVALQLATR